MKKILITGANSYIGTSFEKYINDNYPDEYLADTIDMLEADWKKCDFHGYDSIIHVAGIAHRKETKENKKLYYDVNRDLSVEVALKAKADGVKHFVFLSSMSVYGKEQGVINENTLPSPKSNYGISKLQAEKELLSIETKEFKVLILRPPMVYGKGCRGNFETVVKLVKKFPVFPKVKNRRSMIYIDNLCEYVKRCVDMEIAGMRCPQNLEKVCTSEMAYSISKKLGKKVHFSILLGVAVSIGKIFLPILKKAFGSLIYESVDELCYKCCNVDNKESFERSV